MVKNYISLKYIACEEIFKLLIEICDNNKKIQIFMFKFILIFIPYIGQGDFVCDLIKTITENNDRLLLGLFNIK